MLGLASNQYQWSIAVKSGFCFAYSFLHPVKSARYGGLGGSIERCASYDLWYW